VYRQLVRHFFGRFFDTESLAPQGEPQAWVVQTLGILAVPSAFFVLLFRPLTLWDWSLVGVRYLFVLYSMVVMGFVMVFEWDALFLDSRDHQILTPMPIRRRALLAAKASALAIFLAAKTPSRSSALTSPPFWRAACLPPSRLPPSTASLRPLSAEASTAASRSRRRPCSCSCW
jgi:hypothetical protein